MAVAKVIGKVDGVDVVLSDAGGGRWTVPVPFDEDGEYVVEILAEDEAGNQAYMAKMLFVVNTAQLCAHIVPLPFYGELLANRSYNVSLNMPVRDVSILELFTVSSETRNYYGELILSECGDGRRLRCSG